MGSTETRPTTGKVNDSIPSCVASLGLGNTVRAESLEGDVWGALKPGQPTGRCRCRCTFTWVDVAVHIVVDVGDVG